jgi:asparagine synthase (glutamine-hydrolysing)
MSGIGGFVWAGNRPLHATSEGRSTWTADGVELRYSSIDILRPAFAARGRLAIVAAARIDGKSDLLGRFDSVERAELNTVSDAELILRCFERWGADCLNYLIGAFSFAVWDGAARSLFCARDQFGMQLFFYSWTAESFSFSNALDALRTDRTLDKRSIADFLLFGEHQDPSATAFAHIRRLPPGHSLFWQGG